MYQIVSKRLAEVMEITGITFEELSAKSGVPKSSIHRYIAGTTDKIPIDRIEKIAHALNVSPAYIVGWDDSPAKDSNPTPKGAVIHDSGEQRLVNMYRQLNPEGQGKLLDNADDLVKSGKYRIDIPTAGNGGTHAV